MKFLARRVPSFSFLLYFDFGGVENWIGSAIRQFLKVETEMENKVVIPFTHTRTSWGMEPFNVLWSFQWYDATCGDRMFGDGE